MSNSVDVTVVSWNVLSSGLRGGPFEIDPTALSADEQLVYNAVQHEAKELFGDYHVYQSETRPVSEGPTIEQILDATMPSNGTYRDLVFRAKDDLPIRCELYRGEEAAFGYGAGTFSKSDSALCDYLCPLDLGAEDRLEIWQTRTPKQFGWEDRQRYKNLKPFSLSQAAKYIPYRKHNQWLTADREPSKMPPEAFKGNKTTLDLLALQLYDIINLFIRDEAFAKIEKNALSKTPAEIWNDMRIRLSREVDVEQDIRETFQFLESVSPDLILMQEVDARWMKADEWRKVNETYLPIYAADFFGPDNGVIFVRRLMGPLKDAEAQVCD